MNGEYYADEHYVDEHDRGNADQHYCECDEYDQTQMTTFRKILKAKPPHIPKVTAWQIGKNNMMRHMKILKSKSIINQKH